MLGILPFATLLVAANTTLATGNCKGADPAIVGVVVQSVSRSGDVNHYTLSGSVMNRGTADQPSNVLQSVDVYQNGQKVGAKGVPPLTVGQVYKFPFTFQRAADAQDGSTRFTFKIHMHQPAEVPGPQDCSVADDELKT